METKFPLGGESQNSDKVVFKNHKNKYYLTAEPVMGMPRFQTLESCNLKWMTLLIRQKCNNWLDKIKIGRVVANRAEAKKWETWSYKVLEGNKISLMSYHDRLLSAIPGGESAPCTPQ